MRHGIAISLTFVFLTLFFSAAAQEEQPGVKLKGRVTKQGTIRLRWAPNSPVLWQMGNQYGYTLERIAMTENGRVLTNPPRVVLNVQPIKPARQELWESVMHTDDYAAVAAQAIFGEEFDLVQQQSEIMQVINKARELESRFSFALFAADQSVKAAELSGLYFEDEKVAPGVRYLYRVYANIPEHLHKADTGFFLAGLPDYVPLPRPRDLQAEFEDHRALLSWEGALFENIYNSFWVERSDDGGKTFERVSEQPIVNTFAGDRPNTRLIFKTDSLPSNDVTYHYRVMGINAFGETGPPSDTVSGAGRPVFGYSASVTDHEIEPDGTVNLRFTFPSEGLNLLRSFALLRVDPRTKQSETIRTDLGSEARTVKDETPHSSNYYVIEAYDRYGRSNRSFPYLVQLEDSIPPGPPVGLSGRIDTLGHVYLSWKPNSEDDLLGYTIYRANFKSDEYIQIKGPIRSESVYVDTIGLDNLTEKIYYKVSAVDRRYNYSPFSEVLELQKPDLIPPSPPVLTSIRNDSTGITLTWIPSGSEDVVQHLLYRRSENDDEWTLIRMFNTSEEENLFTDRDVTHRAQYFYTLLAVDDAGLESTPATPVSMRRVDTQPYPEVESVFYRVDREKKRIVITWNYDHPNVDRFLIYRAKNGGRAGMYKAVDGSVRDFVDEYGMGDEKVEYWIGAKFITGEQTRMVNSLLVEL